MDWYKEIHPPVGKERNLTKSGMFLSSLDFEQVTNTMNIADFRG